MPQGFTSPEDVSAVLEHLAKYELVRKLENHSLAVHDFLTSFDINISNHDGNRFSPSCIVDIEEDSSKKFSLEINLKNKGTKILYVCILNLGNFWQIEDMYTGNYDVIPPLDTKSGFAGNLKKKIRTIVPEEMKEKGYCEDILKVMVTSHPASFNLLELPKAGCLSRKQHPRLYHQQEKEGPEQWATFNFPLRNSAKAFLEDVASSRVGTDVASIFSEGLTISSKTESSFGQGQRDAIGLLATLLFYHGGLSSLYTASSTKVTPEKLQMHLLGPFRKYGADLIDEARSGPERRAAAFVQARARHIVREIRLLLVPNDWETAVFLLPTEPSESSREIINKWLISAPEENRTEEQLREPIPQRLDQGEHDEAYSSFEDARDEYGEDTSRETYQALEMAKEFLLLANAFRILQ
ncbi:uncharacterized protein FTOL_13528 [Fusarium torulosum]|uniref:Uncharacterized protein n=1 Tax=Fusarium torulosum TaxID=33205 RepID=A0AAE8MP24_9HYPO|nr:uncharacterized protein FTOL_13528 [Fusarium torulosum]